MRRIGTGILALLCALALVGCAVPPAGLAAGAAARAGFSNDMSGLNAPGPAGNMDLGEARFGPWYGFGAVVDGATALQFPLAAAELAALGWRHSLAENALLAPNETIDASYATAGGTVTIRLANLSGEALPPDECRAVGLLVSGAEGEAPVLLAQDIAIGLGRDAVAAWWGNPDPGVGAADPVYRYSTGRDAYIELTFTDEEISAITLVRLEAPAPPPESLPAEVRAWAAPEALGAELWDYDIRYDGDLYTLPAPVAAFLENGWVLRDEGEVEPGSFLMGVTLCRGNQRLRTRVVNFSDSPQPLAGCFVVMAESGGFTADLPLELAGGLTSWSTYDEALALLGEPHETYWERVVERRTSLTWHGPDGKLVLRFLGEPGEMELYELEFWHNALA